MQLRGADSRSGEGVGKVRKNFFFEKKKQKTFGPLRAGLAGHGPTPREAAQSFFATFFSKKVVLTFLFLTSCAAPRPQYGLGTSLSCVPYAREVSGIQLSGNAWQWWGEADGLYPRTHTPSPGAVMVFAPHGTMTEGHLAVVTAVVDGRTIRVTQANWLPGRIETNQPVEDISSANDWSSVRVWYEPVRAMGTKIYPVYGFILPR